MKIIKANERKSDGIKGVIIGKSGVGKTSLLYTLPESNTLCLDLEAGLLAVNNWKGDSIEIKTWEDARAIACLVGGANPSLGNGLPYSPGFYKECLEKYKYLDLSKYKTIFVDSFTVASRLCMNWAKNQPENYSKTKTDAHGNPALDMRGCYGTVGREMVDWFTHIQHAKGKNIWFAGGIKQEEDDMKRPVYFPLMEGKSAGDKMPYIFDQVISMIAPKDERQFVCTQINKYGLPAKDRSGTLDEFEPADLGKLMGKIMEGKRNDFTGNTEKRSTD